MRITAVLLYSLLTASALIAQPAADVSTFISGSTAKVHAGDSLSWSVFVTNRTAGVDARDIVAVIEVAPDLGDLRQFGDPAFKCDVRARPIRCTLASLGGSFGSSNTFFASAPKIDGDITIRVTVSSSTPDRDLSNNTAFAAIPVSTAPDLTLRGLVAPTSQRVNPGAPLKYDIGFTNAGITNAKDVVLTALMPPGETIVSARIAQNSMACSISANVVRCTTPLMWARESGDLLIDALAPASLDGGSSTATFTIVSSDPVFLDSHRRIAATLNVYRWIVVTNTEDDGFGSLRQAIRDANTLCNIDGCRIAFRIPSPAPANGVFTIQPRTALPEIVGANVIVDGTTQTAFGGDTNAAGPEIELNGSLLAAGNGLVARSVCARAITGLTINGFPNAAIRIEPLRAPSPCPVLDDRSISYNYLGTDAAGLRAVPNLRGIESFDDTGFVFNNLISGNRRSGIAVWSGFASIAGNRIGITASGDPLPNHGAGVFVNDGASQGSITLNRIDYNDEFGISIGRKAASTEVRQNSMKGNGLFGFDIGLDFATPNSADDSNLPFPNKPLLTSAKYDPVTDTTTISGRLEANAASFFFVTFFLVDFYSDNALPAQGETYLGSLNTRDGHADFAFTANGDLRGRWISATNTRQRIISFATAAAVPMLDGGVTSGTSEFSNPIRVPNL
jgi:uncharacterized repeat protein (TIGR01451 family)